MLQRASMETSRVMVRACRGSMHTTTRSANTAQIFTQSTSHRRLHPPVVSERRSMCTQVAPEQSNRSLVDSMRGALRDKKADTRTYVYGVTTEMMQNAPESVRKMLDVRNASQREQVQVEAEQRAEALKVSPNDVGSAGVVVARLSVKIENVKRHMETLGRKDFKAKRQMQILLGHRRRLLKYLRRKDVAMYVKVLDTLDLPPIKLFPQMNKLAPVSRRDHHSDQLKKNKKYGKGKYQHLYDVPTSHNIKSRIGQTPGFKDTVAQVHLRKQKELAKSLK